MLFLNKLSKSRTFKGVFSLVVFSVFLILFFTISTQALGVKLNFAPNTNESGIVGDIFEFLTDISVTSNDPEIVSFVVSVDEDYSCEFDLNGNPLGECDFLSIIVLPEDVDAAFLLGYGGEKMYHFKIILDSSFLSPGEHNILVRAYSIDGQVVNSNSLVFKLNEKSLGGLISEIENFCVELSALALEEGERYGDPKLVKIMDDLVDDCKDFRTQVKEEILESLEDGVVTNKEFRNVMSEIEDEIDDLYEILEDLRDYEGVYDLSSVVDGTAQLIDYYRQLVIRFSNQYGSVELKDYYMSFFGIYDLRLKGDVYADDELEFTSDEDYFNDINKNVVKVLWSSLSDHNINSNEKEKLIGNIEDELENTDRVIDDLNELTEVNSFDLAYESVWEIVGVLELLNASVNDGDLSEIEEMNLHLEELAISGKEKYGEIIKMTDDRNYYDDILDDVVKDVKKALKDGVITENEKKKLINHINDEYGDGFDVLEDLEELMALDFQRALDVVLEVKSELNHLYSLFM